VKFTDAELLGMPWILTVSPRSLAAGGIEVQKRATGERWTHTVEEVEALLRGEPATEAPAGPRG
jgi:prolyl-tRNA synthetase